MRKPLKITTETEPFVPERNIDNALRSCVEPQAILDDTRPYSVDRIRAPRYDYAIDAGRALQYILSGGDDARRCVPVPQKNERDQEIAKPDGCASE
jgi:hypothetical protein